MDIVLNAADWVGPLPDIELVGSGTVRPARRVFIRMPPQVFGEVVARNSGGPLVRIEVVQCADGVDRIFRALGALLGVESHSTPRIRARVALTGSRASRFFHEEDGFPDANVAALFGRFWPFSGELLLEWEGARVVKGPERSLVHFLLVVECVLPPRRTMETAHL